MSTTNPMMEAADTIIDAPDIASMTTDEAVRYLVETFGTDEHDALELVLVAKGELTNDRHVAQ
jgi:hypothetical protein